MWNVLVAGPAGKVQPRTDERKGLTSDFFIGTEDAVDAMWIRPPIQLHYCQLRKTGSSSPGLTSLSTWEAFGLRARDMLYGPSLSFSHSYPLHNSTHIFYSGPKLLNVNWSGLCIWVNLAHTWSNGQQHLTWMWKRISCAFHSCVAGRNTTSGSFPQQSVFMWGTAIPVEYLDTVQLLKSWDCCRKRPVEEVEENSRNGKQWNMGAKN